MTALPTTVKSASSRRAGDRATGKTAAPTLVFERSFLADGHRLIAGCDEVGRGALAGPVSVGMVVIDASSQPELARVRDSKLLTPAARVELVPQIKAWAVAFGVGHASAAEVDAVGLIAALRLAGTRAWLQVLESGVTPEAVILDGNHNWLSPRADPEPHSQAPCQSQPQSRPEGITQQQLSLFDEAPKPESALLAESEPDRTTQPRSGPSAEAGAAVVLSCDAPVFTKIKADMQCLSVAAASVLAKVERDGMLTELDAVHPGFGWAVNKGYATAAHRAAIAVHGPSPYHRLSWRLTAGTDPAAEAAPGKG